MWVPKLSIIPLLITSILSQFFDVDILWVEIKTVIFLVIVLRLFIILSSVWVSTAERLSSKISILGLVKSYEIANEYEHNLRVKSTDKSDDFDIILLVITEYLKTL